MIEAWMDRSEEGDVATGRKSDVPVSGQTGHGTWVRVTSPRFVEEPPGRSGHRRDGGRSPSAKTTMVHLNKDASVQSVVGHGQIVCSY